MENEEIFKTRVDLSGLKESVDKVKSEISKIIVGQEKMVELLITAVLADGHVLLEGVPGVAKTLTAKLLSKVIQAGFSRVQFTPDLMPSDVLGTSVFNVKTSEFTFKQGPIFSNIILIDEINRAPAKTQSALFEVMEERQATVDGQTYPMEEPYLVVATQNPIEQEGTYRLPEAQLDRFLFKISVDYPGLEEEVEVLKGHHARQDVHDLSSVEPVLDKDMIKDYRTKVHGLHVDENLMRYIAQIVNETRNSPDLYLGASPRASIAILQTAKAFAGIQGRDFITPEDIKFVANPVMRHRVILTPEKEMEGQTADSIIDMIVEKIEVPR
ncbi:MAG: MoxR family ATPase [Cytophagales bacterium]|nr:MoxR family ATPase [Cytophagales bacterium]